MVSARDHCICWKTVARHLPSSRNLHNPRACLAICTILPPALPSTREPRARFYRHFGLLSDVLYSSSAGLEFRSPSDGRQSRSSLSFPLPPLLSIVTHSPLPFRTARASHFFQPFQRSLGLACVTHPLGSSSSCLLSHFGLVSAGWHARTRASCGFLAGCYLLRCV